MKILLCFGTRPEAIKMAPVIFELRKQKVNFKVCVTAQHREMLDQVLNFFEIIPQHDLNLMSKGQSLNALSSRILEKIDPVLEKEEPDLVLVQGDTTTAVMVSMAAFHRKIKVGHIEAGLRTYNPTAPFPEEINRQITARIANYHFTPTIKAFQNLISEGIPEDKIFLTGNTIVDAMHWGIQKVSKNSLNKEIRDFENLKSSSKKLILVTGHRRENFGYGLREICKALTAISELKDVELVYPVHLNPMVKNTIYEILGNKENVHLIPPLPYPSLLWLMQKCDLIISDSGGIQEEAPSLKKPVIVTREVSERMEGVEAGFSFLVGTDRKKILEKTVELINTTPDYSTTENPYGDGKASEKIVHVITSQ